MGHLRFHVDRCDDQWISGWADEDGHQTSISLEVDGRPLGDIEPANYRPDLERAGIGDGRRAFDVRLAAYLSNGPNRVVLKFQGEAIHEQIVSRAPLQDLMPAPLGAEPGQAPARIEDTFLWPADGATVQARQCVVVAKVEHGGALPICLVYPVPDDITTPPGQRRARFTTRLQPIAEGRDIFFGRIYGLGPNKYYAFVILSQEKQVLASIRVLTDGTFAPATREDVNVPTLPACSLGPLKPVHPLVAPVEGTAAVVFTDRMESTDLLDCNLDAANVVYDVYPADEVDASRSLCSNFGDTAVPTTWSSPPGFFCRISGVKLFVRQGVVLFAGKHVWSGSPDARDAFPTDARGVVRLGEDLYVAIPDHRQVEHERVPVILSGADDYARWLLCSVPAAWHALRALGTGASFVLPTASPRIIESLALVGVDGNSLVQVDGEVCSIRHAIYPSMIDPQAALFPSPHIMGAFKTMKDAVTKSRTAGDSPPRRLLITRGELELVGWSSVAKRLLRNAWELEARLEKLGFTSCRVQNLDQAEQVYLFSNAELIVALRDGALANMVFAPAGCVVIEMHPGQQDLRWLRLAQICGHRYAAVALRTATRIGADGFVATVDVEQVERAIRHLT